MKKVIIDISEISLSKEMYLSKPNPFLIGLIYSLVGILIAGVVYSCFGKVDIYATTSGVIRPNDDVSTVSTMITGKVTQVNVVEGQIVKEGELLYKIDTSDLELSLNELKDNEEDIQQKIIMYNKYLNGINTGENPFDSDICGEEYAYYVNYMNYSLSLKNSEKQYLYDKKVNEANISNLSSRVKKIDEELSGLNAYKESIENGENRCSDFPRYESMYLLYEASINSMKAEFDSGRASITSDSSKESNKVFLDYYNEQIAGYDKLISSINSDRSMFEEGDNSTYYTMYREYTATKQDYELKYKDDEEVRNSTIKVYKSDLLSRYGAERDELKAKADNLSVQLNMSTDKNVKLGTYDSNYYNSIDAKYYQAKSQIDNSIESLKEEKEAANGNLKLCYLLREKYNASVDEKGEPLALSLKVIEQTASVLNNIEMYENQLTDVQNRIKQVNNQIAEGSILAQQTGNVNLISSVAVGDIVNSGIVLATIIPPEESEYKVQMYVTNADIAGISVGDLVKYDISALPYNQYGVVEGKVTSVSRDTLVQNGGYSGMYLVEGSISNEVLKDSDGNEGEIGIGMQVTGRIVTQRKTIFRYLLEKIDIF